VIIAVRINEHRLDPSSCLTALRHAVAVDHLTTVMFAQPDPDPSSIDDTASG